MPRHGSGAPPGRDRNRQFLLPPLVGLALAAALLVGPARAQPAPVVPLPRGAVWTLHAPRADEAAKAAAALLQSVGRHAPAFDTLHVNEDLLRRTGLSLLDPKELAAQGVRETGPWTLFEREGVAWLAVEVSDAKALVRALDARASARELPHRRETALTGRRGRLVTRARGPGTRPAMAWALSGDHAVLLLDAAPAKALEAALAAFEGAAPARPSVAGPLLLRAGPSPYFKEAWIAATPSARGLDLAIAGTAAPGVFAPDRARSAWVREAAGDGPAKDAPPLAQARFLAGPSLSPDAAWPLQAPAGAPLAAALGALGAGPAQWLVGTPDPRALAGAPDPQSALAEAAGVEVLLPGRDGKALSRYLESLGPPRCGGRADGTVSCRAGGNEAVAAVVDGALLLRAGRVAPSPTIPSASPPTCAAGEPVAAARAEPAELGRALARIGLLQAMGDEALMAVYAVGAAWGGLLRASGPATALLCAEPSGRVRGRAQWRLAR